MLCFGGDLVVSSVHASCPSFQKRMQVARHVQHGSYFVLSEIAETAAAAKRRSTRGAPSWDAAPRPRALCPGPQPPPARSASRCNQQSNTQFHKTRPSFLLLRGEHLAMLSFKTSEHGNTMLWCHNQNDNLSADLSEPGLDAEPTQKVCSKPEECHLLPEDDSSYSSTWSLVSASLTKVALQC